ncbi:DUF1385 domain-containing protein [Aquihabitans sp. McL0605]|uniref:DUF1385 domain-containing protein n=1 Tax=Aquihabitans sp. McL0605 TaxID=3415671 RepID=UPI003CEC3BCC
MPRAQAIDTSVGPIGGQALPEGVMMRRGQSWGAAVRRQDGSIGTTSRILPASLNKWRTLPLVRGVMALGETAALGTKATVWAAQERGDERGDGYTRKGLFATVAIAIIAVVGVFGLLPAVLVKLAGIDGTITFPLSEGLIRLGILVGYLFLLGRSPQVQRVFAYHGAEHMTIHAFEHRVSLTPEHIRTFSRRHPRCGTAFLLVVVITTMFVHAFMGHQSWQVLVVGRILGLPLVAGIAYEAIRFAGRHQHQLIGRLIMAPGSWLQGITTAEPTDDMIEVAVAALEATLAAEPLAAAVTTAPLGAVEVAR